MTEKLEENGFDLRSITTKGEIIKINVGYSEKVLYLNLIFTEKQHVVTAIGEDNSGNLWGKIVKEIISEYADEVINENI